MNTLEIEIALMRHFNPYTNLIIPNSHGGLAQLHECDLLILNRNSYATEIEIKISKADLLNDKNKKHKHLSNYIARFYFAVPEKLIDIALKEIPERAGLYSFAKNSDAYIVKKCKRNKNCVRWSAEQRNYLNHMGAIRIYNLKEKILELKKIIKLNAWDINI